MNKYLPALICGFGSGVLLAIPFLKNTGCCLIVPGAVILALFLYKNANKLDRKILTKEGMMIGLLTGFYAALFGSSFEILITFITKSNQIVNSMPEMKDALSRIADGELYEQVSSLIEKMVDEIQKTGFSPLYALSVIVNNFVLQTVLGTVAGLAGIQFVNRKVNNRDDDNFL